jgi:hypothetical protein
LPQAGNEGRLKIVYPLEEEKNYTLVSLLIFWHEYSRCIPTLKKIKGRDIVEIRKERQTFYYLSTNCGERGSLHGFSTLTAQHSMAGMEYLSRLPFNKSRSSIP